MRVNCLARSLRQSTQEPTSSAHDDSLFDLSLLTFNSIHLQFGDFKIIQDGKLHQSYDETKTSKYMKSDFIDFDIEIFTGNKSFTVYTMDFTKKYIEINADYRS